MSLVIPKAGEAPAAGEAVVSASGNTSVSAPIDATTEATRAAAAAATAPKAAERPAWLPEGIDTPEALAEAYKALKTPAATTPATVTPTPTSLTITTPAQAEAVAKEKGVDLNALSAEFASTGVLSDASLKLLETKGISKSVVDSYIAGQQAVAAAMVANLATHVGGPDVLNKLMAFGSTGLTAPEIEAFNSLLATGNEAHSKLALDGLKAKYENTFGTMPEFLTGTTVPAQGGIKPFTSQAEVTAIMRTTAYKTDPAVQAEVAKRLNVSNF